MHCDSKRKVNVDTIPLFLFEYHVSRKGSRGSKDVTTLFTLENSVVAGGFSSRVVK